MTEYTTAEKLTEIEREIAMRKRHYPAMIARGTLSYNTAAHHLAVMKAIAEDYRDGTQGDLLAMEAQLK